MKLLAPKADAAFLRVNLKHDGFNLLASLEDITWLLVANMHQAFNARLNLHECTELCKVRYCTLHYVALVYALADGVPRISGYLLYAEGYSVLFAVNPYNLNRNLVAFLEHVADLHIAFPRKLRNVYKTIKLAEIHEHAEICKA